MLIDATVYPANSTYVTNIVNMTKTILNMADTNCAHLQCPLYHSQTVPPALLKHQRTLEDSLVAGGCDVMSRVSLHFDKSQARASDTRMAVQLCLAVTSNSFATNRWKENSVFQKCSIGPVPLIRVSDMIGFDSEIRLGASARAEQTLDSAYYSLSFFGPPIIIDDDNFARTLLSKSLFNIVSSKRLPNMSTKEGSALPCPYH